MERVYLDKDAIPGNVSEREIRRQQAARVRATAERLGRFLREQDERLDRLGF